MLEPKRPQLSEGTASSEGPSRIDGFSLPVTGKKEEVTKGRRDFHCTDPSAKEYSCAALMPSPSHTRMHTLTRAHTHLHPAVH